MDFEKIPDEILFSLAAENSSSTTKRLEKRRELFQIEEELEEKRLDYLKLQNEFKEAEDELNEETDELNLQINMFLNSMNEKKVQLNQRKKKEKNDIEKDLQTIKDIEKVKEKLEIIDNETEEVAKKVNSTKIFVDFLQSVCTFTEDGLFNEISDISSRYDTLSVTNQELSNSIKKIDKNIVQYRTNLMNLKDDGERYSIMQNNVISKKQHEVEAIRTEFHEDVNNLEVELSKMLDNLRESGRILFSSGNLFSISRDKFLSFVTPSIWQHTQTNFNLSNDNNATKSNSAITDEINELNSKEAFLKRLEFISLILIDLQEIINIAKKLQYQEEKITDF
eukprot:TRINITY_DN7466_c0_g1_i1.p1 TRINITY_DN7466_c0_g1~~TRINITY_DN7466_c0_g1_i1.p1  ORF type:complete len:337 (-),score=109.32 TRINITY_DN7466_c0_g1_i1:87-1097(-)